VKQPIEKIQVSDAIQFTGVNMDQMKEAWKTVQANSYYSLLDYNCVYAIWEILMPQLNCHSREQDIFFSIPTKLFEVLLEVGAQTGMGQRIVDKHRRNEMTNKFHTLSTSSTSDSFIDSACGFSTTMYAGVAMAVTGMFLVGFEISRRWYKK